MRFDWYQATVDAPVHSTIEALAKLGHEVRSNDGPARAYRYRQGWEVLHRERGLVARVFAGGNGYRPHVLASSDATDAFVDLVRNEWPDLHLVTRMDAAEDFIEPGAYRRLRRVSRKVAKGHRMTFQRYVDELHPDAGETQYIGSKKSQYMGRLYQKGFEQVAKLRDLHKGYQIDAGALILNTLTGELVNPADWARMELQARPKGEEARRLAAVATPEQAWTFTDWSQELAREAMALDLERFYIRTRKVSKDEEAMRWMCMQYGGMLARCQADLGDWACVGKQIGDIIRTQTNG